MMGYKIFKHLYGSDPRLSFVGNTGLSAYPHNHLVVLHAVNKRLKRIWENFRVRIDLDDKLRQVIPLNKGLLNCSP